MSARKENLVMESIAKQREMVEILKDYLDSCMRLPMTDKVRALNLSNCAAILVYEALRQQEYPNLLFDEPHKSKMFIEED